MRATDETGAVTAMTTATKWKLAWMALGALVLGLAMAGGTYSFDIANPSTTQDVVIVRNASIAFGEASPGTPPPISAWYPAGGTIGHQFRC